MAGGWPRQLASKRAEYCRPAAARSDISGLCLPGQMISALFIPADLPQIFTVRDLAKMIRTTALPGRENGLLPA